ADRGPRPAAARVRPPRRPPLRLTRDVGLAPALPNAGAVARTRAPSRSGTLHRLERVAGRTQEALYAEIDLELSWSEDELPQYERTKHVHSLHPYLGKFVPQLVEVFLTR